MEASSINEKHPDDVTPDDEDFFGGATEGEPEPGTPRNDAPRTLTREEEQEKLAEYEERTGTKPPGLMERDQAALDRTDPPVDYEESSSEPEPPSEPAPDEGKKESGSVDREYIVLQRIPLNKQTLEALLKQIKDGDESERYAFVELDREVARNDKQAILAVYKRFEKKLGEKCDLAAVSSRSFKQRQVRPRKIEQTRVSVS